MHYIIELRLDELMRGEALQSMTSALLGNVVVCPLLSFTESNFLPVSTFTTIPILFLLSKSDLAFTITTSSTIGVCLP